MRVSRTQHAQHAELNAVDTVEVEAEEQKVSQGCEHYGCNSLVVLTVLVSEVGAHINR